MGFGRYSFGGFTQSLVSVVAEGMCACTSAFPVHSTVQYSAVSNKML